MPEYMCLVTQIQSHNKVMKHILVSAFASVTVIDIGGAEVSLEIISDLIYGMNHRFKVFDICPSSFVKRTTSV